MPTMHRDKPNVQLQNALLAAQAKKTALHQEKFSAPTLTPLFSFSGTYSTPALNVENAISTGSKLLSHAPFVPDGQRNGYKADVLAAIFKVFIPVAADPSLKHRFLDLGYVWASMQMATAKISKKDIRHMPDNDLLNYVRHLRLDCSVGTRHLLKLVAGRFYREMQSRSKRTGRDFFAEAGYDKKNESEYSGKSDSQLFQAAIKFIAEFNKGKKRAERIETITDFMNAKGTPFWEDYRRQLNAAKEDIERVSIKDKLVQKGILSRQKRNLSAMTNAELIAEALGIIRENGFATIQQFSNKEKNGDPYLAGKLAERLGISRMLQELHLIDEQAKPKQAAFSPAPDIPALQHPRAAILPTNSERPENMFGLYPNGGPQGGSQKSPIQNGKPRITELYPDEGQQTADEAKRRETLDFILKVMTVNSLSLRQLKGSADWSYLLTLAREQQIALYEIKAALNGMGERFVHAAEKSEDFALLKGEGLLGKVRAMKIKSVDELLRYKPLCKQLEKEGMLLAVMGWYSPVKNNHNGKKENGRNNVIQMKVPKIKQNSKGKNGKGNGNGRKAA